jgi:isopenicillin N synthase-like dioxygenase
MTNLPIIDMSGGPEAAAGAIGRACRELGFFYVTGHGVPAALTARLEAAAREFFALPHEQKMEIEMARGERAWRGYFPVGAELTSGRPDRKEGLYFGAEIAASDPRAALPLHGPNLFPRQVPALRAAVLEYLEALDGAARSVLHAVAASLGREPGFIDTTRPTVLFRIFHYPPAPEDPRDWGVGEHTDYGLLTLLAQDDNGGLQVRTPDGWIDAPPVPGSLVCNIGDMLERVTAGRYRSTPHRVRNVSGRDRLSYPYFFDPDFTAPVPTLDGTYGDYLLAKVGKVFPDLAKGLTGELSEETRTTHRSA